MNGDQEEESSNIKYVNSITSETNNSTEVGKVNCPTNPVGQVLLNNKLRTEHSKVMELKSDNKELIKQLFLVYMPDDFYSFWEMCESLNRSNPLGKYDMECLQIELSQYKILNPGFYNLFILSSNL